MSASLIDSAFRTVRCVRLTLCLLCLLSAGSGLIRAAENPPAKSNLPVPNILWISLEDISPDFGCYGDKYARTPVLDAFAAQGVRFTHCFSHAPVCAPARSGLITGMHPTSIGTHQMRCQGVPPPEVKCFSELLRRAGYYCTNNVKTDYQFAPPLTAWDENSGQAHWRKRKPGQPFFAVFNFTTTHESQVRDPSPATLKLRERIPAEHRHDPAQAVLPPYYPDTPAVRKDWASYHDNITATEFQVTEVLKQLEADGLADDTIVWIWGDHGRGLPRGKRWLYDSGLQVPLLLRVPEKWRAHVAPDKPESLQPGTVNDRLVSFIDFAPTMLSLARVEIPQHLQGQAFLGPQTAAPRQVIIAGRDRMDERPDCSRAVRDARYKYIRNFHPHRPWNQYLGYAEQMPTLRELHRLQQAGQLNAMQWLWMATTKPVEELYDTQADPHEVRNLASDPALAETLTRLRGHLANWMTSTGDLGLIPEPEFDAWKRPGDEFQKTAAPRISSQPGETQGSFLITAQSATPGASIAWRVATEEPAGSWQLYVSPVEVRAEQAVQFRAVRIGFQDSPLVKVAASSGEIQSPEQPAAASHSTFWRETIAESPLLEALWKLPPFDGQPQGLAAFQQALHSEQGSVRYWGVVGLSRISLTEKQQAEFQTQLQKFARDDASPVVRIAAAESLCRRQQADIGLPVLRELLKYPQGSVRHYAALALDDLDELARPALPDLQQAQSDKYEYTMRVATRAVQELSGKLAD